MSSLSGLEIGMFNRTQLLLGQPTLDRIAEARVIIFGVGGVGSWCAESLVRSGIRHLTIVDSDLVCITNCNRQLMATAHTVGRIKVDVLKERLLDINPKAEIEALEMIYNAETAESFHIEQFDYVIDAIDSLQEKADLILQVTAMKGVTLFSSMGAALRVDPLLVREAEFWNVKGDALARAIRNKFKRNKTFPKRKFRCVYSEEQPMSNLGVNKSCGTGACMCPKGSHEWCSSKAQINGSMSFVTGAFGFALASLVIRDIHSTTTVK